MYLWYILHYTCCLFSCGARKVAKGGLFPRNTRIVGYARSDLTVQNLKDKCQPFLKASFRELLTVHVACSADDG